jgi:superfamily II DNA helicase RecQ
MQAVNIVTSFDRPNIYYHVEAKQGNGLKQLLAFLEEHNGENGINFQMICLFIDQELYTA